MSSELLGWESAASKLMGSVASIACLAVYAESAQLVASSRAKFAVEPPRTDGPPEFQRCLRAQQNTLEFLVFVLPLIWMNVALMSFWGGVFALVGGLSWAGFRYHYIQGYAQAAEKRLVGFYGSMKALNGLFVTTVIGCLYQLALVIEYWG